MLTTDFYALMGIDLAVCAVVLRATSRAMPASSTREASASTVWPAAMLSVGLWLPYGDAGLPLLAFARGILSDLSVTSVVWAVLYIVQRLGVATFFQSHEKDVACGALVFAALVLYPTALGWGDWDAYRIGWGSAFLVTGLSLFGFSCFWMGLRLLPLLIAAALMAWSLGVLESGNLWDYLIDPWIACVSIGVLLKLGLSVFRRPVV